MYVLLLLLRRRRRRNLSISQWGISFYAQVLHTYNHTYTHTHTQGACRHANVKRWWSDGRLRYGVLEAVRGLAQGHLASAQKVNWHPLNHQSPLTYSGDRFDLEIKS